MSKALTLILIFITAFIGHSPCPIELDEAVEIRNDHRNHVYESVGTLKSIPRNASHHEYYREEDQNIFSIGYSRNLWAGAFDPPQNFMLAANTYPQGELTDFGPGPFDLNPGFEERCEFYRRVWKVTADQLKEMKANYEAGTLVEADIPIDILEWPAQGNARVDNYVDENHRAPYWDSNGDALYDPMAGDRPIVLEENPSFIPHEFAFSIYQDINVSLATQSDNLGLEIHQMDYVVNCSDFEEGKKSIFTRIKYINRSLEDWIDFKLGIWDDSDLGCIDDDYYGCDTLLNCAYVYNSQGIDGTESCIGILPVPEDHGVVRSLVPLSHQMKSHLTYYNGGVGIPPPAASDPQIALHYYGYMSGEWLDGLSMTKGGNGYDPSNQETTRFAYTDLPTDPSGWSMETSNNETVFEKRAVITLVEEAVIPPGQIGILDFADHILYDSSIKGLDIFNSWPSHIEALRQEFESIKNGNFDCERLSSTMPEIVSGISIYPNPTQDILVIEFNETLSGKFNIFSNLGQLIKEVEVDEVPSIEIDLTDLETGTYILEFNDRTGKRIVQNFVKVK